MRTNQAQSRRPTGIWVTDAGLVMFSAGVFLVMFLDGRFDTAGFVFALTPLVLGALVVTGNRWLILLVTLISAFGFVSGLLAPMLQNRLLHPEQFGYFAVAALEVVGSAIAAGAGLMTFVQIVTGGQRRPANWA